MGNAANLDANAKWRRLLEGLPGHGRPGDPTTAVLFHPALLAKCLPVGDKDALGPLLKHPGSFRLVSKECLAAFDAANQEPLTYHLRPGRYGQEDGGGASPSEALGWSLGMLQRGRRPTEVCFVEYEEAIPEGWQQSVLDFLQAIPWLSGRPGEAVASLQLPPQLLSPSTAPVIAKAFPNLTRLELGSGHDLSPLTSRKAARGLALLLGVRSEPEGKSFWELFCGASAAAGDGIFAHGEGASPDVGGATAAGEGAGVMAAAADEEAGADEEAPLLPRLTALNLRHDNRHDYLPPGFATVLRQAAQLRTLVLEWAPEDLALLSQLTALKLHSCAVRLLPVLTGALTRLTSLKLRHQVRSLPSALFAPLQGLQRLKIPRGGLEAAGLAEALPSLTRLTVGGFTLPSQELSQRLTNTPRWRLPAGLRELGLGMRRAGHLDGFEDQVPEVLAGLEPLAGLRLVQGSKVDSFSLHPGRHTAPPVEDGGVVGTELLPAAEEALCGALRFLHQHELQKNRSLTIKFTANEPDRLLQPVGGAAGTGPGRPNHGRWLRELGTLAPTHLTFKGVRLSDQDVETIVDQMGDLEVLCFMPPCKLPIPALPLLARLPRLRFLTLDAAPWAGDDPASSELRDQALAALVALAHARPEGRHLTLIMFPGSWGVAAVTERMESLATRLRQQVPAWKVHA